MAFTGVKVQRTMFQSHFTILWRNEELDIPCNEIQQNKEKAISFEKHTSDDFIFGHGLCTSSLLGKGVPVDDDGDLVVSRRLNTKEEHNCSRDVVFPTILTIQNGNGEDYYQRNEVVKIEHTMATTLDDVGKQIWRGALFLADYILWKQDLFRGSTVLEFGAGTGFTSVVMATVAKRVYSTDVGEDLLKMCENNVVLNRRLTDLSGGEVKVKVLDWHKNKLCSDPAFLYSWTKAEISDLYDETTVILAADVFYDKESTDALFKILLNILNRLKQPCTMYFSIERRFNFTLRDMNITSDGYNHFQYCLNNFQSIKDKQKWKIEEIKPTFPQYFTYERSDQLELWKIIPSPMK
ncbi:methyltransferase-like protein 22 [Pelobates fuscus]|uniref:methyltransferase-like protein 22 n=1 Tax=Pelobates fuscus TaxID=191477 RepID=UPI002FE4A467